MYRAGHCIRFSETDFKNKESIITVCFDDDEDDEIILIFNMTNSPAFYSA